MGNLSVDFFRDDITGQRYEDPGLKTLIHVKGAINGRVKTPKDIRKEDHMPLQTPSADSQFDDGPRFAPPPPPQGDAISILANTIKQRNQQSQGYAPQPQAYQYQQYAPPPPIRQGIDPDVVRNLVGLLANYMPAAHFNQNEFVNHVLGLLG